jgi:hypothetical protein
MSNDEIEYMKSLHKIYALIPEGEYQTLKDSGILTSNFDLWLTVIIKEKLEKEGYLDANGIRTEKLKNKRR